MLLFVLKNKRAVSMPDSNVNEWGRWLEKAIRTEERRVNLTRIAGVEISTIFLGLNHGFGSEPPLLFESMIFGRNKNLYSRRYRDWEEAERGHLEIVNHMRGEAIVYRMRNRNNTKKTRLLL